MSVRAARWRRWIPVLLVCAACALPATRGFAATTPLQVALLPCNPPSPGAACRVEPTQVQVDVPSSSNVQSVEVAWVPGTDRPSSAPSPASPQAFLTIAKGTKCQGGQAAPSGTTAYCWNWPSSLEDTVGQSSWLLNGTYTITACTSTSDPCTGGYDAATTKIAVPPATPANVSAAQSNGVIKVTWNAGPEPDLVGYTVTRNNQVVYTCSTDGAGPGAGRPCANPPSFSDQPGPGTWTYAVSAIRFGADSSASDVVTSPAALASPYSLTVSPPPPAASPGPATGTYTGGSTGGAALPALPPMGVMRPAQLTPSGGIAATALPSIADTEDSGGTASGTPSALPYNDNPALNGTLASGTAERQQKPKGSIDPAAELALAVLALALAVHVWYVRGELRVASVRVAARRAAGEAAG